MYIIIIFLYYLLIIAILIFLYLTDFKILSFNIIYISILRIFSVIYFLGLLF